MAINKSNKGPMNGSSGADGIDRDPLLTDLERIGQKYASSTNQRDKLTSRMNGLEKERSDILESGKLETNVRSTPFYSENLERINKQIDSARGVINGYDSNRNASATQEASNIFNKRFSQSSINGVVNQMRGQADVQNRAFGMAHMSYDQLQEQRESVMGDINFRSRNAQNQVSKMFNNGGQINDDAKLSAYGQYGEAKNSFSKLAAIQNAMDIQKQAGIDTGSRFKNLAGAGSRADSILNARDIGKEVQSGSISIMDGGNAKSVKNVNVDAEIMVQATNLASKLKELAEAAAGGATNLDDLRTQAEESADNLKKLEQAQAGGAGGGRNNTISNLNAFGAGFNAVGNAANTIMIGQRMQQVGNIGGYAGIANNQYDMYRKARGGDIASQLSLGQTGLAGDFGDEMKNASRIVSGAQGIGAGAQATAGGLQLAASLNPIEAGTATSQVAANATAGALNLVQGGANLAVIAGDTSRRISENSNKIAGYQAMMQAQQAINAVGASQAQGLRDTYTGLDVVGQDMGSKASAFIQNSSGPEGLQKMMDARMSPEQFIQQAQSGVQNMGSTFDSNQIFAARNLERGGFGSMQTNMGRMSSLAAGGANNPQAGLESVLSAAVSKGLDSSKSITMMVDNTAAMSASSLGAAVGIDTIGASSSLLASSMNPALANKEFALSQAMTAQERTKQVTTNASTTFTGMANTAGLQQAFSAGGLKLDGVAAINLQKNFDIATLKSLQGNPNKASEEFRNQGINIAPGEANQAVSIALKQKQLQVISEAARPMGLNAEDVLNKRKNGTLTDAELMTINAGAGAAGRRGGGKELFREVDGIAAPIVNGVTGKALTSGEGPDDVKKQMDILRTSGFKQLSEAAGYASKELGGFTNALKTFTDLQSKFEKGGMGNEGTFSTAAGDFAKSFGTSTGRFEKSVTQFEVAIKNLNTKSGLTSNSNPIMPEGLSNLNQRKDEAN